MIAFEKAHEIVLAHARDFGVESIPLNKAINRVLRESWSADRDMPPYDRVTMDGIAIRFDASKVDDPVFEVVGVAAAGAPQMSLQDSASCLEVMTGAILPDGADTVIRYEDIEIKDGKAHVNEKYNLGQNIHVKGEDRKQNEVLLSSGMKLSASEIGVGSSIGMTHAQVARMPKTVIISTGDELVEINETPLPYQIRKSNVYRISATLEAFGLSVDKAHLDDDFDKIVVALEKYLEAYELIILSGGVSMGKFDYLPQALEKLGVIKHFHKVAQRPGKPFWFGSHGKGATVFALPGNPVSSFMCTQVYLMDWLRKCLGTNAQPKPYAILQSDVTFTKPLTYFLEVKIEFNEEGQLLALPQRGHGSGDLANLMNGDAFIQLPRERDEFEAGERFPIHFYR